MHYIYLVANAMDRFDPLADLLISEDEFLTWRRGNQRLPNSENTWLVYMVMGRGSDDRWFLAPSMNEEPIVYPGIHAWLDRTAADAEHGRLGMYAASLYAGILGLDKSKNAVVLKWMNEIADKYGFAASFNIDISKDEFHERMRLQAEFLVALYDHTAAL